MKRPRTFSSPTPRCSKINQPERWSGQLTGSDPDSSNTFSYTLVSGTGSDSNAFFTINGTSLETAGPFDADAQNTTLSLRILSTDQGGLRFEKVFAVSVLNTNQAPPAPTISRRRTAPRTEPLTPTLHACLQRPGHRRFACRQPMACPT